MKIYIKYIKYKYVYKYVWTSIEKVDGESEEINNNNNNKLLNLKVTKPPTNRFLILSTMQQTPIVLNIQYHKVIS